MIGHNPGLEQALVHLAQDDPQLRHVTPLSAACFIHLELEIDHWVDLKNHCAHIKNYLLPNELQ